MKLLPTWPQTGKPYCTKYRDELIEFLQRDKISKTLDMYFYAITKSGWDDIWPFIDGWQKGHKGRKTSIYCGLSNWVSEPAALQSIREQLPNTAFVISRKKGVFHAKAFVFHGFAYATCFVGSNNLSRQGFQTNFELGVIVRLARGAWSAPKGLLSWERAVQSAALPLTADILGIYTEEFNKMEHLPRNSGVVGRKRVEHGVAAKAAGLPLPHTAILEVMPKETGTGGSQLQIPLHVARAFFGLRRGRQKSVTLHDEATGRVSTLTLTDYPNITRRLAISRLAVEPRPCVIWFKKENGKYRFDIVSRRKDPDEYNRLLMLCPFQTTSNSKHWGMYE